MKSFELKSPFQDIRRKPLRVADETLIDPDNANALVIGEFLEIDTAYKYARGSGAGVKPAFALFNELGRTDVQAGGKVSTLFMHAYEADTQIMDATGLGSGDPLMVTDVDIGGVTRRGLAALPATPAGDEFIVGYVLKLPAANGGFLRFLRV